jgi:hypothetical protein
MTTKMGTIPRKTDDMEGMSKVRRFVSLCEAETREIMERVKSAAGLRQTEIDQRITKAAEYEIRLAVGRYYSILEEYEQTKKSNDLQRNAPGGEREI